MSDDRIRIIIDGNGEGYVREVRRVTEANRSMAQQVQAEARRTSSVYQDAAGKWRKANGQFVTSSERAALGIDAVGTAADRTATQVVSSSRRQVTASQAAKAAYQEQKRTVEQLGRAARTMGLGLGIAAGVGLAEIIKAGAAFQTEMARVKGVTQANDKQMAQLNATAKKLGAQTKFSAGEAAQAMYELASAGFTTQQTINALPGTLSLAAASGIELKDAAEISANALNGFGLQAAASTHVADVMAQAVASSSLEMTDLQLSMKYVGSVGRSTGQSLESVTAALSLMAGAGIKGEQAGTTLRGGLLRLVKPTKQVEAGFASLGINAQDLQGPKGLKPLADIIRILQTHTEGMTVAQRNQALAQIFGTESLSGMLRLVQEGPTKLDKLTGAYQRSDGASKKMATTMNDTVAGAFENFKGSIETVEITLFEKFQKPLQNALNEGAKAVNKDGKKIEDFLTRVTSTKEFKQANLGGQIKILAREAEKEWQQSGLGPKIEKSLVQAFDKAIPVVATSAGKLGIKAAETFGQAFLDADPLGKIVLGGLAAKKLGGFAALGKLLGGRLGGGIAGGLGGGMASKATPTPVFVTNPGFGGSGGLPAAGGGGGRGGKIMPFIGPATAVLAAGYAINSWQEGKGAKDGQRMLQGVKDSADKGTASVATLRKELEQISRVKWLHIDSGQLQAATGAVDDYAHRLDTAKNQNARVVDAMNVKIKALATQHGSSLSQIRRTTASNMQAIRQRLGADSAAGRTALTSNFEAAAAAVKTAMDESRVSTQTGLAEIKKLTAQALATYGYKSTVDAVKAGAKASPGRGFGPAPGDVGAISSAGNGFAQGGVLSRLPGAPGPDSIPMAVNGRRIIAAPGEDVAIINQHQRRLLDQRLGDMGGLPGLFRKIRTPHQNAGTRRYATGGIVSGRVSTFGPPGEAAGRTASGLSSSEPGIALNTAPGTDQGWNNPTTDKWVKARQPFRVSIQGHSAILRMIDKGPAGFTGRAIDVTGAGAQAMGIPQGSFPTDALGTAQMVGPGAVAATGGASATLRRVLAKGVHGPLGHIVQASLDTVRGAAMARLAAAQATATPAGAPSIGLGPSGPQGLAVFKGVTMAKWIADELAWASARGWSGQPTSGYRPGRDPHTASGNSEHQGLQYPHGAVDFGGFTDPNAYATKMALLALAQSQHYPGPRLIAPIGFHDDGHLSGTGHAKGGLFTSSTTISDGVTAGLGHGGKPRKVGLKLPRPLHITKARRHNRFTANRIFGRLKVPYDQQDLDAITGLESANSTDARLLGQLQRQQDRSDEATAIGNLTADGSPYSTQDQVNAQFQALIAQHAGELDGQATMSQGILGRFDGPGGMVALAKRAATQLAAGLAERQLRLAEIKQAEERNQRRIKDSRQELTREQHRPGGWREQVQANDRQQSSLEADLAAERRRKHPDRKVEDGLTAKLKTLKAETSDLKSKKPKGGSKLRKRRLMGELDFYQDLQGYLTGDQGLEGKTTTDIQRFQDALGGVLPKISDLQLSRIDAAGDLQDILDQKAQWTGQPAPKIADAGTSSDSTLVDLLRQQLADALKDKAVAQAHFQVFSDFQPMLQGRLLGSFARGIAHVPQDGLAVLHRDEMVVPDPQGPFGSQLTPQTGAGAGAGPVVVHVHLEGDAAALMRNVRAEVDGRAAKVVNEQLGRRARQLAISPGR